MTTLANPGDSNAIDMSGDMSGEGSGEGSGTDEDDVESKSPYPCPLNPGELKYFFSWIRWYGLELELDKSFNSTFHRNTFGTTSHYYATYWFIYSTF